MTASDNPPPWPVDKLNSLRLGRRLVTEVASSGPGRRAFVDIRPIATRSDRDARREGWVRPDRDRTFELQHREYDTDRIDGFDYDVGAVLLRSTTVIGEAQLAVALQSWELRPEQFLHPWQTADPQ